MVRAIRRTTCRTLVSCPGLPGTPALRKYLLTTMSVASCDHGAGTSTSSIWNTTEPSGLLMTVRRFSQRTSSSGSRPGRVCRRGTRSPAALGGMWVDGVAAWSVCVIADLPGPREAYTLRRLDQTGMAAPWGHRRQNGEPTRVDPRRRFWTTCRLREGWISCRSHARSRERCERCRGLYHRPQAPRQARFFPRTMRSRAPWTRNAQQSCERDARPAGPSRAARRASRRDEHAACRTPRCDPRPGGAARIRRNDRPSSCEESISRAEPSARIRASEGSEWWRWSSTKTRTGDDARARPHARARHAQVT